MTDTIKPVVYCARPVNGGPLTPALVKPGWFYEPKVNGYRAWVHGPTGTMFSRDNTRFALEGEFAEACTWLCEMSQKSGIDWWDCEAVCRRHKHIQHSLIILDFLPTDFLKEEPDYKVCWCYKCRREILALLPGPVTLTSETTRHERLLFTLPSVTHELAWDLWGRLQHENTSVFGCQFYEGLVGKDGRSTYPANFLNPAAEFPGWKKHRWAF